MLGSPLQADHAQKSFEAAVQKFPQCSDAYMLYGQVGSGSISSGGVEHLLKWSRV